MASTSYSSSSSKFDVFLSFRGEDTRYTFTDHLFNALKRAALDTFRDNDEIRKGHELNTEFKSAITESKASIVVLSERYADSAWCLEELCLILEQKRKGNHFVLPVFYHVNPSDVRNQRGSFALRLDDGASRKRKRNVEERVEGSKWTEENVNRWKAALTEVANISGETVSGSENDVIARVVDIIDSEVDLKQVSTPDYLTGMETRAELINSWLKDEQPGTNILAICGMGGSGKTTLARYIYNLNKQNFESSSFIEVAGKHENQPDVMMGLQRQLLTNVLGGKNVMISSVFQGTHKIEEVLKRKKVLIILDDIDDQDEVRTLLGTKTFDTQSKIIITTRLLDIDAMVYKLEMLNNIESLELLCWHAFGSKIPFEGFKELAMELAQYCGGNPLAIKVLGSSLRLRYEDLKKRDSMIEIWRSKLNSLNSLQGDLDSKIQNVLLKSFDSLSCISQKELFLHIACFFVGVPEVHVLQILEKEWYAKSGMRTLVNRCLLTVTCSGELKMHQLLQDMGRTRVRNESKDPAKRSRVWCSDESYQLLSKGDGSKTVEGLSLIKRLITKGTKPLEAIETSSLVKMKNLKLLDLRYMQLVGPYKNFPDLIWLSWMGCNLKTIPSGLLTSRLVDLEMWDGKLEKFEPPTVLPSLKILNLVYNGKLVSICGFSLLPKLEKLVLEGCSSLTHVCKTIGDLKSLDTLDLRGCTKLFKASLNKEYVNQLERLKACFVCKGLKEQSLLSLPKSLKLLNLDECDLEFNNDVDVVFHAQAFFTMRLGSNPFEYLPNYMDLKVLRVLDLVSCSNLKSLPSLPSTLQELYIEWCTSLERITFESTRFTLLKFGYEGCFKLSEIQGLFKLAPIAKIDEADLGDMHWIKAYQDQKVELVGDVITQGRSWNVQMLYEYGIRSTYIQGIKDQSMMTHEYTSLSDFLSFRVPFLHPKKQWIQGVNVSFLYRAADVDQDGWIFFATIKNITKGLTWAYNPAVYCKPRVDEDVAWLSYWPIGNMLDEGDEVEVEIILEEGLIVSGCGVCLVYNDGEVGEEETCENYTRDEEVIGGDLSEFEVTTGGYYLCRRNFSESTNSAWLKYIFGDNIHYTDSQGWRKSRKSFGLALEEMHFLTDTFQKDAQVGDAKKKILELKQSKRWRK